MMNIAPPRANDGMPSGASIGARSGAIPVRALLPGMVIGGRFRVVRRIAAGGMGEVWEGLHPELQLRVAMKTLRSDVIANHEVVARFSREAFLLGRVQSDHVARVFDLVADPKLGPVLVTEFVEGPSLAAILQSKRFSVEEAIDLGIDVVTGLRELHRAHVVHRDVKPANILMRPIDDGHRAVFVDFGVSRLLRDGGQADDQALTEITSCDRAVGTVEYMAPEQVLSSRDVKASADLYAVGAILYRAVAGHHPFVDYRGIDLLKRKLTVTAPELDTGRTDRVAKCFEELVARALARTPDERFESADEMLAELSHLRDSVRRARRASTLRPPPPASAISLRVDAQARAAATTAGRARVWLAVLAALAVGIGAGFLGARALVPPPSEARVDLAGCRIEPRADAISDSIKYEIVCPPRPRAP